MKVKTQTASTAMPVSLQKIFRNRKMKVCSMHGKDLVMRPLVKQYLNIESEVVENINTDEFGTFTGEVERLTDAVTTLRQKILKGLQLAGATLGIGNEGSFGPHPQIPLVPANQEIVMMIDLEHGLEIMDVLTTTETNFAQADIHNMKDLAEFTSRVHFPSHALVLKQIREGKTVAMEKGIVTWDHLYITLLNFRRQDAQVTAETDMRAYLNPTRMKAIAAATEKLMQRITHVCPVCEWPGFGESGVKRGLPCSVCSAPTQLVSATVSTCKHCNHTEEKPAGEKLASPQYCDYCNP